MPDTFEPTLVDDEAFVAYIRPVDEDGERAYAICDADGEPLGLSPTRSLAFAAVRQHGMEPVDAH